MHFFAGVWPVLACRTGFVHRVIPPTCLAVRSENAVGSADFSDAGARQDDERRTRITVASATWPLADEIVDNTIAP